MSNHDLERKMELASPLGPIARAIIVQPDYFDVIFWYFVLIICHLAWRLQEMFKCWTKYHAKVLVVGANVKNLTEGTNKFVEEARNTGIRIADLQGKVEYLRGFLTERHDDHD